MTIGKKGWRIVAILVVALVLLIVGVPYLINVDTYRPLIQARLSSAVGRQVELGHLHLSFLTRSLTADNISIADDPAFSHEPFLRAKSLEVGVDVWPLIVSHALQIKSLAISRPDLTLLRSSSGRWNFSSLGGGQARTPRTASMAFFNSPGEVTNFSVEDLKIAGGRVTIGRVPSRGVEQSYEDVNLGATNVSTTAPFPLSIMAKTPGGGALKLDGTAGPIDPAGTMDHVAVHMKFSGEKLPVNDVQGLLHILGVELPSGSSLRGGTITAHLNVDGTLDRLVTTGPISISNVTLAGFSLASKLGGLASLGGISAGPDTLIQLMSSDVRVAPEGIRTDQLRIVVPALGSVTGAGTISAENNLNFRMVAQLKPGSPLDGLGKLIGLSNSGGGIPFRVQGMSSHPVFIPEFAGTAAKGLPVPAQQGLGQIIGGLLSGKKKP